MPKRTVDLPRGEPLLDIASYARRGPGRRDRLSPAEIEQIERTVRRVPEVLVKVLSRGGQDLKSIQRHLDYIGRKGEVELETDEGERLTGRGIGKELLENWDLDLDSYRRRSGLSAAEEQRPPKLVHKLMFSMPPGTPPKKVLAAVQSFAREEFALKHRYAMVLHTDEPHPHVHMVVKAVSEQGVRLNIRKATLRDWRKEFARHLRDLGVAANATERAVRGESRTGKSDGIFRAMQRGGSTYVHERIEAAVIDLAKGARRVGEGRLKLIQTRSEVNRGWLAVSDMLSGDGKTDLAARVARFVREMPPPRTDAEWLLLTPKLVKDLPPPGVARSVLHARAMVGTEYLEVIPGCLDRAVPPHGKLACFERRGFDVMNPKRCHI